MTNKMTMKQIPGLDMDFAREDVIVKNSVFLARRGRR